jgi:hypothetical protein
MIESGRGGMCLLCGGIDGRCKSGFRGEDGYPEFKCFHVKKKITIHADYMQHVSSDIMGYLINEAPEGTILVEQASKEPNMMTVEEVKSKIPNMVGKLDALLKYLHNTKRDAFGEQEFTDVSPHIAYCADRYELCGRIKALQDLGFLLITEDYSEEIGGEGRMYGRLTAKGALRVDELLNSNKGSDKVFIAMGFHTIYSDYIKKAAKKGCFEVGLLAETVDESNYVGDINDRIISDINRAKFVIADYTCNNMGVYYESGYARGRGIPVIETCNKEWFHEKDANGKKVNSLHFDVEHRNMILWETENDLAIKIRDRLGSFL